MIERKSINKPKIGVFAVAHAVYNEQFEGLYEKMMGYHSELVRIIESNDVEVIDFGMIDSSEKAYQKLPEIAVSVVCLLICNMTTYATSSVFAPHNKGFRRAGYTCRSSATQKS